MSKNQSKAFKKNSSPIFGMEKNSMKKITEKSDIAKQKQDDINLSKEHFIILYEIFQLLILRPTLEKILYFILERIREKMGILGLAVWLKDKEGTYSIGSMANLPHSYVKFTQSIGGKIKEGEAMVGVAAKTQKPIFEKDIWSNALVPAKYLEQVKKEKMKVSSLLCIPLLSGQETIGVLNFYFPEAREDVAPSDLFFLSSVANQLAILIQNSKTLLDLQQSKQEIQKERGQLAQLQEAVQFLSLGADKSLQEISIELSNTIGKALGSYALTIWKVSGDFLRIFVVNGLSQDYYNHFNEHPISLLDQTSKNTAMGMAAITQQPAFKKDFWGDPGINVIPKDIIEGVKKEIFNSVASFPLIIEGKLFGALNFYFLKKQEYLPSEKYILQVAANTMAIAIGNAQYKKDMQRERGQLAQLQEAVKFLSLSTDKSLQEIVKELSNTIGKALGVYGVAVWEKVGKKLKILNIYGLSDAYRDQYTNNPIMLTKELIKVSAIGKAIVTRQPYYLPDFWADSDIKKLGQNILEMTRKEGYRSVASLPLIVEEKVFGVLNFYFFQIHEYLASEKYILQVAADTMSIAIGNARYRQASKDAQIALVNMLEDTEAARSKAEEERRKTEIIIANFSDGLLFFDAEDNLFLINPQAEIFFGIQGKDLVGKSLPELGNLPVFTPFVNFLGKDFKGISRREFSFKENLTVELSIISMGTDKEKFGNLVILHDVTREKIVERLKTEFVSLSAHQLRTPLSAIKWTLRMLLDGDLGALTNEQRGFIDKTYQSNERMIGLVNDLLDVTRIEEGRYLYKPAPASIESIIQYAMDSYADIIKENDLKIEFKKPDKKIPAITIDVEKMRLAVQNIIDNAVKYTVGGGKIDVLLEYNEVKKEVEVQIKDAGIGIPKGQQPRVFAKFFRADNALKIDTTGSGLGLFIAKNIIEAHGGKIWFKSPAFTEKDAAGQEYPKGTIFYFTLPVKKEFEESLKEL